MSVQAGSTTTTTALVDAMLSFTAAAVFERNGALLAFASANKHGE